MSIIILAQQQVTNGNQFFTTESLVTFAGASAITFVIANGIQRAFNYNPRWLALLIAILVCLFSVYLQGGTPVTYVIAIINGFLVFNTATGATALSSEPNPDRQAVSKGAAGANVLAKPKRKFLSSWF